MFVVKRPFRDATGMVSAGSVVEPAGIKRFRHRLAEGHIVEVNEHNFERYADFFKKRYGVDLPSIKPVETTGEKPVSQPTEPVAGKPATVKTAEVKTTEIKKVVAAVAK